MDVKYLVPFVAVAEELHFGRAAKRLHMSQPPLSRQIRRLEDDLGVQLLVRDRHGVRLTPAGRAFLEEARLVLSRADAAARMARRVASGEVGTLRVGHVDASSSELLAVALGTFHECMPEVRLVVQEATTEALVDALLAGELDVALVRSPVKHPTLSSADVAEEALVVALPEAHQLAAAEPVSLSELADETFVLPPRHVSRALHDRVISACEEAGFRPNVADEAFPASSAILLVAAGAGVSMVPALMSRQLCQRGVAYQSLVEPPLLGLALVWRAQEAAAAVDTFADCARKASGCLADSSREWRT